jgi:hypothetical protein
MKRVNLRHQKLLKADACLKHAEFCIEQGQYREAAASCEKGLSTLQYIWPVPPAVATMENQLQFVQNRADRLGYARRHFDLRLS